MVSVVIPFKNAAICLPECIASLRSQTYQEWEAILMDDHSDDAGVEVIQAYQDKRIRVHSVQGQGIVAALNEGLEHCRFPLIARMDADDVMPSARLQKQVDWMLAHPETGLVSGRVQLFSNCMDSRGYQRYVDWINSQNRYEDILLHRFVESPFAHPSVLFRRELITHYGAYREGDFPEDYELWLRWLQAGVRMEKIEEVVLNWRDHETRLSRAHDRYRPQAFQQIRAQYIRVLVATRNIKKIWFWGDGSVARAQRKYLEAEGIRGEGIVEVDRAKCKGIVHYYEDLGGPEGRFMISLVGNVGAREKIQRFLEDRGWKPGDDFILAG